MSDYGKKVHVCCICKDLFVGWGNNPYPVVKEVGDEFRCCDKCNMEVVVPERIRRMFERGGNEE